MSAVDNTGELRKLAFEIQQARTRVADRGAVVITAMIAVVVSIVMIAALDTDRFEIDASRWIMAAASVGTAVTAIGVGAWWLDKRTKNRTDEIVGRLDALCSVGCHNAGVVDRGLAVLDGMKVDLGALAAQMEQLDARIDKVAGLNRWMAIDRDKLLRRLAEAEERKLPLVEPAAPPTAEQVEQMPPADVKDIAKRAFDTGRRVGRREAEG